MTEREKRDLGLWYDANYDAELLEEREKAEELCFALNHTAPREHEKQNRIIGELLAQFGEGSTILAPFNVDYGYNCRIGDNTFVNHYAYFMDCAPITIGNYCLLAHTAVCTLLFIRWWPGSVIRDWRLPNQSLWETMSGLAQM